MSDEDIQFMLEAIDHHWAFKFKTKTGFQFWVCRDVRLVPEGQVGLTKNEFAQLSQSPDPSAVLLAKATFQGSSIKPDELYSNKNAAPFASGRGPSTQAASSQSNLFERPSSAQQAKLVKKKLW